jgi:hypothetical protein
MNSKNSRQLNGFRSSLITINTNILLKCFQTILSAKSHGIRNFLRNNRLIFSTFTQTNDSHRKKYNRKPRHSTYLLTKTTLLDFFSMVSYENREQKCCERINYSRVRLFFSFLYSGRYTNLLIVLHFLQLSIVF